MARRSNLDLVEFHLSYNDMDEDPAAYLQEPLDMDFVVHSPELFAGDHIMDLCAEDFDHRQRSIDELQRVLDITRKLTPFFRNASRPMIIINAGGYSLNDFIPSVKRDRLHDLIAESLSKWISPAWKLFLRQCLLFLGISEDNAITI